MLEILHLPGRVLLQRLASFFDSKPEWSCYPSQPGFSPGFNTGVLSILCAGMYFFSPHTQAKLRLWNGGEGYYIQMWVSSLEDRVWHAIFLTPLSLRLFIKAQSPGQDRCAWFSHRAWEENHLWIKWKYTLSTYVTCPIFHMGHLRLRALKQFTQISK